MFNIKMSPQEGDIYKVITVSKYKFELRYGYYEDFERASGDPVVIYPDLIKQKLYTEDRHLIVTAIQDPCKYYDTLPNKVRDECCNDCIYYIKPDDEIGICICKHNQKL